MGHVIHRIRQISSCVRIGDPQLQSRTKFQVKHLFDFLSLCPKYSHSLDITGVQTCRTKQGFEWVACGRWFRTRASQTLPQSTRSHWHDEEKSIPSDVPFYAYMQTLSYFIFPGKRTTNKTVTAKGYTCTYKNDSKIHNLFYNYTTICTIVWSVGRPIIICNMVQNGNKPIYLRVFVYAFEWQPHVMYSKLIHFNGLICSWSFSYVSKSSCAKWVKEL